MYLRVQCVGMQKDGFDKVVHIFKNDLQSSGSGPGGPQWEGSTPKSIESIIEDQAFLWVYDSAPRLLKKQIINFLNIFLIKVAPVAQSVSASYL
jgi:hypothetical protein